MNAKLTLAIATAATLVAAPAAFAQSSANSYGNTRDVPYERSTQSGLPSTSPQVESLSGNETDPWTGAAPTTHTWNNSPQKNGMSGSSGTTASSTYGTSQTYGVTGSAGSTGPAMSNSTMGSSAPGAMGGVTNGSVNRRVIADLNHVPDGMQRRGPGQTHTELMQTALLNTFSAQGYAAVRDFHKQGSMYVAQAQDPQGNWSTVQIDPTSGTIVALR